MPHLLCLFLGSPRGPIDSLSKANRSQQFDHASAIMKGVKEPITCCIIGSFRQFYKEVCDAYREFSNAGVTVLSPKVSTIVDPSEWFVKLRTDDSGATPVEIQLKTLEFILGSSFIYVVAVSGYVGPTTCYEMGRIHQRGIPLFFSEPPRQLPIPVPDGAVTAARDLSAYIRMHSQLPPLNLASCSVRERELCQRLFPPFCDGRSNSMGGVQQCKDAS